MPAKGRPLPGAVWVDGGLNPVSYFPSDPHSFPRCVGLQLLGVGGRGPAHCRAMGGSGPRLGLVSRLPKVWWPISTRPFQLPLCLPHLPPRQSPFI